MEMVSLCSKMEIFIKVISKMINIKVKEFMNILMEECIKGNFLIIVMKDKVLIIIVMVINIVDYGIMI
jgi:hypothetical protein